MDKEKKLPQRKHPRLDNYDYSSPGAYFITICTQKRKCTLSDIVGPEKAFATHTPTKTQNDVNNPVGRGLAPAETQNGVNNPVGRGLAPAETQNDVNDPVGRGLAPAETTIAKIEYTDFGKIAKEQLLLLEERFQHLKIDSYVIMPNHIHVILILDYKTAGASPRPTVMDIICAYKSLTTRECKKIGLSENLFQTSFYEHIIKGREDYEETVKYIYENPILWQYDELYAKDEE